MGAFVAGAACLGRRVKLVATAPVDVLAKIERIVFWRQSGARKTQASGARVDVP